ncbi:acetyl-CoA acetyltransferase [Conexibacter sp. CPCC 206217]|uniref:acetyl-CoA acetyltransferase n=1 Tax=Conexibacter sp. CPCC 206217 TaxID=3064574 RepID=UPI002718C1D4|nr:acetyl-CoA acetyltransferase [Conexibacter sp. CPCC 206217]MDO8212238.1 acetyl-CoA acetyltransferase [Conexibacter sp. CPCC 206217]
MADGLRGRTAIVGIAESDLGIVGEGVDDLDLIGQATVAALADAGLEKADVDGIFTASIGFPLPALSVAEYLGVRPRYHDTTMTGGSSFLSHALHAAAAIDAGLCEVALIAYGSTQRSGGGALKGAGQVFAYEDVYAARRPIGMYALAAARHMHQYGTTREQLAEVAVSARGWAQLNPRAFARDPLTIEEVLSARTVCSPLTTRDCCLVTDGGGAVIMTSAERARELRRPPVYLLGAGEATWNQNISQMPDLTVTCAQDSGARAFEMAGLTAADVDVVQLYDAFTINPILFLEDLGFCAKGEGGAFVAGGRIAPGGELPVNTNGGGLSYCHPGMYGIFTLIESTRQLRGEADARQVRGANVALAHGNGDVLSSQATAILGTEATL